MLRHFADIAALLWWFEGETADESANYGKCRYIVVTHLSWLTKDMSKFYENKCTAHLILVYAYPRIDSLIYALTKASDKSRGVLALWSVWS